MFFVPISDLSSLLGISGYNVGIATIYNNAYIQYVVFGNATIQTGRVDYSGNFAWKYVFNGTSAL